MDATSSPTTTPTTTIVTVGTPSVPEAVTREELNDALRPLCELLGVSPLDWYDDPGITISRERVGFLMAASQDAQQRGDEVRRQSVKARDVAGAVSPRDHSELGVYVSVKVLLGRRVQDPS